MRYFNDSFLGEDIDWFALDSEGMIGHFASGGGGVPEFVDEETTALLTDFFRSLPAVENNEVNISPQLEKYRVFISQQEKERYLKGFIFMAQRGIYAYDKTVLGNQSDPRYHLVVVPQIELNASEIPLSISEKLQTVLLKRAFKEVLIVSIMDF